VAYCSAWLESKRRGQWLQLYDALAYCELDSSGDWTVVDGKGNAPNVGGENDDLGDGEGNRGEIMTSESACATLSDDST